MLHNLTKLPQLLALYCLLLQSCLIWGVRLPVHTKEDEAKLKESARGKVSKARPSSSSSPTNISAIPLSLRPSFDDTAPKNVSGLAGRAAYLHCVVNNRGNKSVSWIRRRDLHILTVGRYTYTTDDRFEVVHKRGSNDWILKIKYAQVRDSGNYECQISNKPILAYTVRLNIFAPDAWIVGAPDMHVDKGSTINLTCIITHSPEPPAYIFWYHNDEVVSYDSARGGITVVTERGNVTRGNLLIQNAASPDNGNYTCAPSNTKTTSVSVHVLEGEKPAAMQTSQAFSPSDSLAVVLLAIHLGCHIAMQFIA